MLVVFLFLFVFFFNDTATTEIYTLSLHDALPLPRLQDNILACTEVRTGVARVGIGRRLKLRVEHLQLDLQGGSAEGGRNRGPGCGGFVRERVYCGGMISHSHSL